MDELGDLFMLEQSTGEGTGLLFTSNVSESSVSAPVFSYHNPGSWSLIDEMEERDTIMAMMVLGNDTTIHTDIAWTDGAVWVDGALKSMDTEMHDDKTLHNKRPLALPVVRLQSPNVQLQSLADIKQETDTELYADNGLQHKRPLTVPSVELRSLDDINKDEKTVKLQTRLMKNRNSANASRQRRSEELKDLKRTEALYNELKCDFLKRELEWGQEKNRLEFEKFELVQENMKAVAEINELQNKLSTFQYKGVV